MYVEYNSNNSGGHWWLDDEDWLALEKAGWKIQWCGLREVYEKDESGRDRIVLDPDGTPKLIEVQPGDGYPAFGDSSLPIGHTLPIGQREWLGAKAMYAYRSGLSFMEAVEEWERVTGKSSTDAGCPCCGQPHTFTEYDNAGGYVQSGPSASYEASW